ncbi:MAG: ABC transporter ATP-binding protein, partial [Candidatus Rokubacteria bacterium]|nr:ABC transporter ATP-binding protein [Candidatus Rokubacteria bacterium]
AVIIGDGRILFDGTPRALIERSPLHNAVAAYMRADQVAAAREALREAPGVARVESHEADGEGKIVVYPLEGRAIVQDVSRRFAERAIAVERLEVERPRLDEVFRRLTLGT